ncbi:MAG: ribonuclease HI family protein [Patescibacteria group bacterium]
MKIEIYTDGGAIDNPGQGAIGVVIRYSGKIKEYAERIGDCTNNQAEYKAVIFGLKKLRLLIGKEKREASHNRMRSIIDKDLKCFTSKFRSKLRNFDIKTSEIILHLDSELVGNQLLGKYKIKDKELAPLFIQYWNLKIDLPNLKIKIVPREQNKEADKLVKSALFKKELF